MSASDSHIHVTPVNGGTHCLECGEPIVQPSDSHRAEIRAKILKSYLANVGSVILAQLEDDDVKRDARLEELEKLHVKRIMALLDSERERWIGEVKAALPAKNNAPHKFFSNDLVEAFADGQDNVLDAVSKVLDEL